jgi:hypothetical protein
MYGRKLVQPDQPHGRTNVHKGGAGFALSVERVEHLLQTFL